MFSKKFIDDVRAAADIVEIVGEVIELKAFHGDRYKGLCPFHNESTPSFTVDNGLFCCFGCGEGGDAIRFIERTKGINFGAAVRQLAQRYGLKDDDSTPYVRPRRPVLRSPQGITQPMGYIAPSAPFSAAYDPYAADLFADLNRSDYDLLLTLGIVPSDLIMELSNDVGMSHL